MMEQGSSTVVLVLSAPALMICVMIVIMLRAGRIRRIHGRFTRNEQLQLRLWVLAALTLSILLVITAALIYKE